MAVSPIDLHAPYDKRVRTALSNPHLKTALSRSTIRLSNQRVAALQAVQSDLDQARRQAEAANAEKSRFLAAVSHDLRQPVQAQRNLIHLLAARQITPEGKRLVNQLETSIQSSATLLNAILDRKPDLARAASLTLLGNASQDIEKIRHGEG